MTVSRSIVFCVCLVSLSSACFADRRDYAPNPEYQAWKAFKVGTSVRVENSSDPRIIRFKTGKLVAVSADAVTVEFTDGTITVEGTEESKPEPVKIRAEKYVGSSTTQPTGVTTEGDEEMTVAGRKVQAHWRRTVTKDSSGSNSESTITRTVWTSMHVPGFVVMDDWASESGNKLKKHAWKIVAIDEPK